MTTIVESRLGDRLDHLAGVYLQDPMKWEQITALNPGLNLSAGLYLEPGLFIEIPELLPEKIPDLLPWNQTEEIQIFDPVEVPPDVQPGAAPDEILSGSGWLTPAQIKALLQIPTYTFPLSVEQGGTNAATAQGARDNIGAVGFADLPTLSSLGGVSTAAFNASLLDISAALALKLNASARSAANGVAPLGADSLVPASFLPTYPTLTSLGAVSTSTYTAGLAAKVDTSTYTAGLALKLDAALRNAINGVAGLDGSGLLLTSQVPTSIQFQLLARSGTTTAIDLNSITANQSSIKWIDGGGVTHTNLPGGLSGGTLLQYDSLFGVNSNTVKVQEFVGVNGRIFDRVQFTTWLSWYERAYLNKAQAFSALQDFGAGASFKGGSIPAVTVTMTQQGVDASGNPRVWLVNASATTGNRLKSITVASNGNIQFRHHADDGTDGNVLEHTASGNVLTNGTLRPGNGSTAFTGASFVPGSTYFRTDISVGGSATGATTFSDGFDWLGIQGRSLIHQGSPNVDNFSNGWTSCDTSTIDGFLRGWHVCTSYRPNNSAFAIQQAFCDTSNGVRYRIKVSGVWQAWKTVTIT